MELTLQGRQDIGAPREAVWRLLLDAEAVAGAAPGVEAIRVIDDTHWEVDAHVGVGPFSLALRFVSRMHDLVPPESARMDLDGHGAGTNIHLATRLRLEAPEATRTILAWEADARVSGPVARLGPGLVDLAARAFTHDFWRRFAERAAEAAPPAPDPLPAGGHAPQIEGDAPVPPTPE